MQVQTENELMNNTASAYLHQLQPFAIQFTESIGIRWYGLAYLSGFALSYLVILWVVRQGRSPMRRDDIVDFVTMVAIGTMIGGRLGYCVFYAPDLFLKFSSDFPFWGVLEVHKGGMASHGGILGVIVSSSLYAYRRGFSPFHAMDLTVFGGSLGIFFGRLANFVNGELFGRICEEACRFGVKFPQEVYLWYRLALEGKNLEGDPLVKLKSLGEAVSALGRIQLNGKTYDSISPGLWQSWVDSFGANSSKISAALGSLVDAVQMHNAQVVAAIEPVLSVRYPSQLYQALMEGLGVFVVLALIWMKPRKVGVVSAWFGILYALARIVGEAYRLPDAEIGYQFLGLTRGQILSIVMLAMVFVYFIYVVRRSGSKVGGWGVRKNTSVIDETEASKGAR